MRRFVIILMAGLIGCGTSSGGGKRRTDASGSDALGDVSVPPGDDASTPPDDDASVPPPTDIEAPPEDTAPPPPPAPAEVDPTCIDGQYTEDLPPSSANIQSDIAAFTAAKYQSFALSVLSKRYPVGEWLVQGGLAEKSQGNCIDMFTQQKSSAKGVIDSLSTIVHECGHMFDFGSGGFDGAAYQITPGTMLSCAGGSIADFGGKTFARSLLNADPYSPKLPPCKQGTFGNGCDSYAPIYLDGNPTDAKFDSGDQGFDTVLEETVQYVNSLATGYAFRDFVAGSVSDRDGILTFLWYVERYLRLARLEHPTAYSLLKQTCWREAILTVWGRAWLYLAATEKFPELGIQHKAIIQLVRDPDLLNEIQLLRDAAGCN